MNFIRKPEWAMPEREATPETVFFDRRNFLKGAAEALGGIAAAGAAETSKAHKDKTLDLYPAKRNPDVKLDRPLTEE